LVVTFLGFYFIFTFNFLPQWAITLKSRQKSFVKSAQDKEEEMVLNPVVLTLPVSENSSSSSGNSKGFSYLISE
jgi:hypothetical protein